MAVMYFVLKFVEDVDAKAFIKEKKDERLEL